jgi:hypothetical protein
MSLPLSLKGEMKITFYLVFTTKPGGKRGWGGFNWRHWRCVESIFYHHPAAEVNIYSNTLPDNTFNVLTDAGYSIKVQRYNLEDMLNGSPAQGFTKKLGKAVNGEHWYSHESDLLRLLLLYNHGGIYMDTDVIVVRPVDTLGSNILGWEEVKRKLNGAFLKFERNNKFLKASLEDYAERYSGSSWGGNGPSLLSRVYNHNNWSHGVVSPVNQKWFYMIYWKDMLQQCFKDTAGETFLANMKTLQKEAYVVHINSKMTWSEGMGRNLKKGTICHHLLNSYCVLCDQQC